MLNPKKVLNKNMNLLFDEGEYCSLSKDLNSIVKIVFVTWYVIYSRAFLRSFVISKTYLLMSFILTTWSSGAFNYTHVFASIKF